MMYAILCYGMTYVPVCFEIFYISHCHLVNSMNSILDFGHSLKKSEDDNTISNENFIKKLFLLLI